MAAESKDRKWLAFFTDGEYAKAIECLDAEIAAAPSVLLYNNKGMALARLDRHEQAMECYDRAIKIEPAHPDAYLNKGTSLAKTGRYEQAMEYYDRVCSLDPDEPIAYVNKSNCLIALGRHDEAVACLDGLVKNVPGTSDLGTYARFLKAELLVKLGRGKDAMECLGEAADARPDLRAHADRNHTFDQNATAEDKDALDAYAERCFKKYGVTGRRNRRMHVEAAEHITEICCTLSVRYGVVDPVDADTCRMSQKMKDELMAIECKCKSPSDEADHIMTAIRRLVGSEPTDTEVKFMTMTVVGCLPQPVQNIIHNVLAERISGGDMVRLLETHGPAPGMEDLR